MMLPSTKSKLATGRVCRKRSSTSIPKPMLLPILGLTVIMLFYHRMYHVYSFQSMPIPSTLRIVGRPSFVLTSPLRLSSASSTNPSKNDTKPKTKREIKWYKMYDLLSIYVDRDGHANVPHDYKEDGKNLGAWLRTQRNLYRAGTLEADRQEKLESLGVSWEMRSISSKSTKSWGEMYDLLSNYFDREGHVNVTARYKEGGVPLGNWLYRQREQYRAGTLKAERQEKLESLGVVLETKIKRWHDLLSIYVDREGHANVPQRYKEDGENLGDWLATQRKLYRAGTLKADRQEKLESLGVVWQIASEKRWDKMYDLLSIYVDREGHANAPEGYKEDGENLGVWLRTQRNLYRAGTLKADRQEKLESLGVVWEMRSRKSWVEMYDLLSIYVDREGNANVPQRYKEDGENLGTWLTAQRTLYKAGTLQADRQEKLESLGVFWEAKSGRWDKMYDLLSIFVDREGYANVPYSYKEDGKNLGRWLTKQRNFYRAGTLEGDRQEKLESLGVILETKIKSWDNMHDLLSTYVDREGHANVPTNYKEDGTNLGTWLATQRNLYRAGTLNADRQEKLESLGVSWEMRSRKSWVEMHNLLSIYLDREGHANVPSRYKEDGANLGAWLANQRSLYRAGTLKADRQEKLELLGVVWKINKKAR